MLLWVLRLPSDVTPFPFYLLFFWHRLSIAPLFCNEHNQLVVARDAREYSVQRAETPFTHQQKETEKEKENS